MRVIARTGVVWLLAVSVFAQTAANRFVISGTVTDPIGAGVPGARVTIQGTPPRSTLTDNPGTFRFAALLAGNFETPIQSDSFAPETIAVKMTDRSLPPYTSLSSFPAFVGR